jgi:hypothetical protein
LIGSFFGNQSSQYKFYDLKYPSLLKFDENNQIIFAISSNGDFSYIDFSEEKIYSGKESFLKNLND